MFLDVKIALSKQTRRIRVGHSPDADDAFMFYALAEGKLDTGRYRFEHVLADIETLNRRALDGRLELTALSAHAYAFLAERYVLCTCGASMGEQYGPIVVARRKLSREVLKHALVAVPGLWTTAYLVLRLCLGNDFQQLVVPFDHILEAVAAGHFEGRPVDAGLIIHEGQLTYAEQGLHLLLDLGRWWFERTGLPLPLGVNALRKDLDETTRREVHQLLRQSIEYALAHRREALEYALRFGRGLSTGQADRFVEMYVNRWTLDLGAEGRKAIELLLSEGYAAGIIPQKVRPVFLTD